MSQAILIVGPTSSGKTALAKALQEELLPSVWLHFSVDSIIYSLPESILERCNTKNDWRGVDGSNLFRGAVASLRALIDSGNRVIFDAVLTKQEKADMLLSEVSRANVFRIKVVCSWKEIERRTTLRGDRTIDEAKRSFEQDLASVDHHVVVDTTGHDPVKIAKGLASRVNQHFSSPEHSNTVEPSGA